MGTLLEAAAAEEVRSLKVAVHGASGRMGQAIVRLAAGERAQIVGAIVSRGSSRIGRDVGELAGTGNLGVAMSDDTSAGLLGADVVIDFSRPEALPRLLHLAVRAKVAVVSGTTRLDATCERLLDEAARHVPVLWSPNTSIGIHVLAELAASAARRLGPGFDVEIVEVHHRAKVDAPSGTAVRLADAVRAARGDAGGGEPTGAAALSDVYGREGNVGPRKPSELGVFAVRGGDVIGDHTVHLLGPGERIELTHRATSRDLFARGALRAAWHLHGKPPGRYTMADVIEG
ncbi:dihydrodipicolinate reductase [Sorangium cellulosum]|jgi:4-hydroxy-tetrahydrodipicolinate reductase|uniref:4-hydroxy-tetrahydrodipicolinate reductase n=1 Tax=Sorangium cellulosum TaxID=56 RepID=A0A4P2QAQ6_SORCE|nr:4-hydroxy-tetrahydrodipicolinate reductase [Sorangium cellulosum]AUX26669.1 dihydrodipicolinate reductase [Sorangium cellulosum]